MSQTKINYTALIFYAVLIVLGVIAVAYVLKINPIYSAISSLIGNFKIPQIQLPSITGLLSWAQQNTVLIGVIASLGTTAVGYFIKNYQTNKLLNQKIEELSDEKLKSINLEDTTTALKEKLSVFETDTTSTELQTTIGTMKTDFDKVVSNKDTEIHTLEKTITQLQQQLDARPVIKIKEVV